MQNLSYENEFRMQFHFHANQSHFHENSFALRLALKQRHKGTRKWPIKTDLNVFDVFQPLTQQYWTILGKNMMLGPFDPGIGEH